MKGMGGTKESNVINYVQLIPVGPILLATSMHFWSSLEVFHSVNLSAQRAEAAQAMFFVQVRVIFLKFSSIMEFFILAASDHFLQLWDVATAKLNCFVFDFIADFITEFIMFIAFLQGAIMLVTTTLSERLLHCRRPQTVDEAGFRNVGWNTFRPEQYLRGRQPRVL